MKVIFFACCTCFPSSFLMKKDITQCSIKLCAEWVLESISQFPLYWQAIIAQSDMLYCRFIFISNIYIFQYMSWVISILGVWHENFATICSRKWKSWQILLLTVSTQAYLIDSSSSSESWGGILRTPWRSVCCICIVSSVKWHIPHMSYMVGQAHQNKAWYLQNSH